MTNREVIETIKKVNSIVDKINGLSTDSSVYADEVETIGWMLDSITIDCPRWKYYKAWELHHSTKSGRYWVTFA